MKLIKPKAELLLQQPGLEGVYKQIELAGRTCYKSTDKITEDSAKPFVDRMINSKHTAMLEHGTVYLYLEVNPENAFKSFNYPSAGFTAHYNWSDVVGHIAAKYRTNNYSKVVTTITKDNKAIRKVYITTNFRVIVENKWFDDLQFICEPTEYHEKRYTFRVITSIGVTREFNRHRVNSIAEQSTRYCNYSKDKFGREVTFCIPQWMNIPEGNAYWADGLNYRIQPNDLSKESYSVRPNNYFTTEEAMICSLWLHSLEVSENDYMELLKQGWKAQEAREVLPLCTATEAVYTAFVKDWQHFFDLRYFGKTGAPHPNMVELAGLMAKEASEHGIWNELCTENVEVAN